MRICAAILVTGVAAGFAQPQRTVLDGVYTEAQAKRGASVYRSQCQGCHGPNLEGTGVSQPLRTEAFLDLWREQDLGKLYEYLQSNMPVDDPGSLNSAMYLDSLAYILQGNGIPSGKSELKEDQLSKILLVGPKGPQPLPPDLLIRVAGCLTSTGDAWRLVSASPPKRVRASDHVNEEQLTRAGELPASDAQFRLSNVPASAVSMKGQHVQVKGPLSADGSVKVESLNRTGASCDR